ncbi:isopenicillin N synthase family dioxygenase [Bradyrhizobium canariense]|jgi:isopenicillin N synthase-like dioxygenase|uniref:2-oxoglutarate-dependent ethylene/succinate-forming enzyme n=1 Tax=Bradyrhizobium canariense TaxID=255045 RepID=A0A1H1YQ69_9BRAD|nr:2-oxoglutarate and iron-dependent oxygenase domain-containing protein [Bradyrhizobium canariense]SDT23537.1 Isopenicillin N synthase [Bradyrhizobium canariense]
MEEVPVIDIASSLTGDAQAKKRAAEEIRRACEEIGFFAITGHGVQDSQIDLVKKQAHAFFARPLEFKELSGQPPEKICRGYTRVGSRAFAYSIGKKTPPDLNESYGMGPVDSVPAHLKGTPAERLFFMPNYWPKDIPQFKTAFESYYRSMEPLAAHLLGLFALALGLDERYFDTRINQHTSTMRVIYYGPQEEPPEPGQLRGGEHTDFGTLTILKAENAPGGLEVKTRSGNWIAVKAEPGAFVCNIGDIMMRWTNNHWISNLHRVTNPPPELSNIGRTSVVFFHNPNVDAEIRCENGFYGAEREEQYPPEKFGDIYLNKQMKSQHMTTDDKKTGSAGV